MGMAFILLAAAYAIYRQSPPISAQGAIEVVQRRICAPLTDYNCAVRQFNAAWVKCGSIDTAFERAMQSVAGGYDDQQ